MSNYAHENPDLSLITLVNANMARIDSFKNSKGEIVHAPGRDGNDWSLLEWAGAMAGEMGELANLCKKVKRGDIDLNDPRIAQELADVIIYGAILAHVARINLSKAIIETFNNKSVEVDSPIRITSDGRLWYETLPVTNKQLRLSDVEDGRYVDPNVKASAEGQANLCTKGGCGT